jgi:hypothetical protein
MRRQVVCATCGVPIHAVAELHWSGWEDDGDDMLSYVPVLHEHRPMEALRCYDPNVRPPGMTNRYCSACTCRKGGAVDEPNTVDEGCMNEGCPCHVERPSKVTP